MGAQDELIFFKKHEILSLLKALKYGGYMLLRFIRTNVGGISEVNVKALCLSCLYIV